MVYLKSSLWVPFELRSYIVSYGEHSTLQDTIYFCRTSPVKQIWAVRHRLAPNPAGFSTDSVCSFADHHMHCQLTLDFHRSRSGFKQAIWDFYWFFTSCRGRYWHSKYCGSAQFLLKAEVFVGYMSCHCCWNFLRITCSASTNVS